VRHEPAPRRARICLWSWGGGCQPHAASSVVNKIVPADLGGEKPTDYPGWADVAVAARTV